MKISFVINTYKWADALSLTLKGISLQSYKDFEVIIAEDAQDEATAELVNYSREVYDFPIKHVSQEDKGFRRAKILNTAIRVSEGDYMVFLDGDCVPHRHFLLGHAKHLTQDIITSGRVVFLDEKITKKTFAEKNFAHLNFWSILFSESREKINAFYMPFYKNRERRAVLKGSNFGVSRKNLHKVNGFNEDFENYGYEECELEFRLNSYKKLKTLCINHQALAYHFYYKPYYSKEGREKTFALYQATMRRGDYFCKNGLEKL